MQKIINYFIEKQISDATVIKKYSSKVKGYGLIATIIKSFFRLMMLMFLFQHNLKLAVACYFAPSFLAMCAVLLDFHHASEAYSEIMEPEE